mgnify:CR=1 FL=1
MRSSLHSTLSNIFERRNTRSSRYLLLAAALLAANTSFAPVNPAPVISGQKLEESRVVRDPAGQIIVADLSDMGLERDVLAGLRPFAEHLQVVDLSGNEIKEVDLSPLSRAFNLYSISLEENRLKEIDLSPLGGLPRLSLLSLGGNRLKRIDLSPLGECSRLRVLHLQGNEFEEVDLSPLASCPELRQLWIYDNELSNLDLKTLLDSCSLSDVKAFGNELSPACVEKLTALSNRYEGLTIILE